MRLWIALGGLVVILAACGASTSPTAASPLSAATAGTPIARSNGAIGYDPETRQTVLFGGLAANGPLGDTWIWDGTRWLQQHPSLSPHSRGSASVTYDPALHALVLFGGDADAPIGAAERADMAATWLWTGAGWTRRDTAHSPTVARVGGLSSGPLAYDSASHRIVMVVHESGIHFIACSAATWTYDGTDWRRASPSTPLPDAFATVVPEPATGHILAVLAPRAAVAPAGLAGTSCPAGSTEARALPQSTTWRWTGETWSQVGSGTEPTLSTPSAELDAVGGSSEVLLSADASLWTWTGDAWQMAGSSSQHPRSRTGAFVSLDRFQHVVLYGGYSYSPGSIHYDTWTWDGSTWKEVTGPVPPTPTPSPNVFTQPPS